MTNTPRETNAQTDPPPGQQGDPAPESAGDGASPEAAEPDPVADRQVRRDERWRERATTAEATVERLVLGEVTRQLAGRVSDPAAALRLGEVQVADLLTDEGDVDAGEVEVLANDLLQRYPSLQPRTHHADIGAKRDGPKGDTASWGGLLKRK